MAPLCWQRCGDGSGRRIGVHPNRVAGAFFFVLAALVMIESVRLSLDDIRNPGPGFLPFVLGAALLLLSGLLLLVPGERGSAGGWDARSARNNVAILAGLILYLVVLKPLGFYLSTFLLLVYLMKRSGEKGYRRTLGVSLAVVCLIYVVFYRLLAIPFPRGVLGI